jgi:hypothetical protein
MVDTNNSREIKQFIDFPRKLYNNCHFWVPPIWDSMKSLFDRKNHPFYKHSQADFFLAESEGEILGRIAVLNNRNYCTYHKEEVGFFYYFDFIEDCAVAKNLLEAGVNWARRQNLKSFLGPKGFLRSDGLGFLIEGFNLLPAVGIPYNYAYYETFLTNMGFYKETDHFSGSMNQSHQFPKNLYKIASRVKSKGKFWIKTFNNKQEMRQWVSKVEFVHNQAFSDNPGFCPSTKAEFEVIAGNMINIADPGLIKLIMNENEVAGFMIAYPDISEGLQKSHGKLWPFGWFHILWAKHNSKVLNMNGLGILPRYQGLGSNALLYTEVKETLRNSRFVKAEIIQVDERNFKSRSDMDILGVTWNKRHRTFRYVL